MNNWSLYKISELVHKNYLAAPIDGNHGEKHPKSKHYVENGIPFLMASDMVDDDVNLEECKFITKEMAENLNKGISYSGDVLFSHKATIGRVAILENLNTPFVMLSLKSHITGF